MITRRGRVVRWHAGNAVVTVPPAEGCARCEAGQGCGQGLLFRWFTANRPIELNLTSPAPLSAGAPVTVGIDASTLGRTALLAFGIPLASLFAGLGLGSAIAGETGALVGLCIGLMAGVPIVRRLAVSRLKLLAREEPLHG